MKEKPIKKHDISTKLNPKDYQPSDELKKLGLLLEGATEEKENLDPKSQYILSK